MTVYRRNLVFNYFMLIKQINLDRANMLHICHLHSCPRMLLRPLLKGSLYTCSIFWLAFIENSKSKMIFDKYTTLNSTAPVSISHIHVTTICFWFILKKIFNHLLIIHNYFFFFRNDFTLRIWIDAGVTYRQE